MTGWVPPRRPLRPAAETAAALCRPDWPAAGARVVLRQWAGRPDLAQAIAELRAVTGTVATTPAQGAAIVQILDENMEDVHEVDAADFNVAWTWEAAPARDRDTEHVTLLAHLRRDHPDLLGGGPDSRFGYSPLPASGLSAEPFRFARAVHEAAHAGVAPGRGHDPGDWRCRHLRPRERDGGDLTSPTRT